MGEECAPGETAIITKISEVYYDDGLRTYFYGGLGTTVWGPPFDERHSPALDLGWYCVQYVHGLRELESQRSTANADSKLLLFNGARCRTNG